MTRKSFAGLLTPAYSRPFLATAGLLLIVVDLRIHRTNLCELMLQWFCDFLEAVYWVRIKCSAVGPVHAENQTFVPA